MLTPTPSTKSQSTTLARAQLFHYALPMGAITYLSGPIAILQGIYAKYYGLSLSTIASILLIANLFDAVTDPLVGYYSDRYQARRGTRKPFMLSGGLLFILGAYYLFFPPEQLSSLYVLTWFVVFYLGMTLFNIPHQAWGSELSPSAKSSTRLFTWRAVIMYGGGLLFYATPQLPLFETREFTPEVLKWSVLFAASLLVPSLCLCLYFVPNGRRLEDERKDKRKPARPAASTPTLHREPPALLTAVFCNRPLLLFLAAFLCSGIGMGVWAGLLFIFVDTYLGFGQEYSLIAMAGMVFAMAVMPFWSFVATRVGKTYAWAIGVATMALGIFCMSIPVPMQGQWVLMSAIIIAINVGGSAIVVCAPALLSDIVDYGTWKFGRDYAGTYFSSYSLVSKSNIAIGSAAGLMIAGHYGYDPSVSGNTAEAIFGLQVATVWLPTLLLLCSLFFILAIPITARRHALIRKALDRRSAQQTQRRAPKTLSDEQALFNEGSVSDGKPPLTLHT